MPVVLVADQSLLQMEIGDSARSGKGVAVQLDGITDTTTGEVLSPVEMTAALVHREGEEINILLPFRRVSPN